METKREAALDARVGYGVPAEVFGETVTCRVPAERTGGAYSLFEVVSAPGGGPPPHVQHGEDESLYVLAGRFRVLIGEETFEAEAGSLFYVARGTLHAHSNVGPRSGRLLLSQTPGGAHERFFRDAHACRDEGDLCSLAARYGIEIPPTPRP